MNLIFTQFNLPFSEANLIQFQIQISSNIGLNFIKLQSPIISAISDPLITVDILELVGAGQLCLEALVGDGSVRTRRSVCNQIDLNIVNAIILI